MRVRAPLGALVFLIITGALHAQSGVGVELDEVIDNRVVHEMLTGSLELRVTLKGNNLDKATSARIIVKDARDDKGNVLSEGANVPDFMGREYNSGTLQVSLKSPARAASTIKLKGTVELFVPTRDPNAVVKIDKALAKRDVPLSHKSLKAAKIEITPLSAEGYAASRKANKLDDAKIAEIRAEAKKRNVPEKEVETVIEFAKAMDAMDEPMTPNSVVLSGKKSDFDRILRVEILGADGKPIDVGSRSTSTRGESSIMTMQPNGELPANAALQFYLLTDKSKMSFPFELSVTLP
jgi:hypothetical protein